MTAIPPKKRVLLVNDLQTVTEILAAQLRALGVESVEPVRDGAAALDLLAAQRFDVVVSDVHMPVLDGFQLCRLMRSPEFPELNHLPVVLVSATYRDQAAARLARDVGAQAFLQWPFQPEDLGEAITRALVEPDARVGEIPRVLVADDEQAIRHALCRVLEREGFEPLAVADGQAAIDAGQSWRPHIVLCDFMMPKRDGASVLAWFREHRPDTPVIILTAHGSERLAVDMMRQGAYDYLAKPFEIKAIPELCRSALEKYNVKRISRQFDEMFVALRRAEGRYRAIFEHAGDAIFVCDGDGRVDEVNHRALALLGAESGQVRGRYLRELLLPRKGEGDVLAWLRHHGPASAEALLRTARGAPLPVEVAGTAFKVEGEEHWVTVARDLTDRQWIGAFVRHEHEFLKHLYLGAGFVGSERDLDALLERALDAALRLLGGHAGAVFLAAAGGPFVAGALRDVDRELAAELAQRLPHARGGITEALFDEEDLTPEERAAGLRMRLELALAHQGRVVGCLVLWRRDAAAVSERDWMLGRSIATYLGLAVENAALTARVVRAQDEWQRTFDGVTEMICVVDAAGRVLRANRPLARRLGREAEALVGQDARALLYGPDVPALTPLDEARAAGEARSGESELPGLGPGEFVVTASPLFEETTYRGAALVVRDVTAERRAQQQLLVSEKMATLGRLVGGVTHELNNPAAFVLLNLTRLQEVLDSVGGLLEEYRALARRADPEAAFALAAREAEICAGDVLRDARQMTSESLDGMRRIREITQELRFFSHIREEPPQVFDLDTVVETATAMTRHELRARARLVLELGRPPPCLGDPTRIGQVVVNLVVNAAQAIDEGRAADNEVVVRTYGADGRAWLEVSDTGRGIAQQNLPRIFDPFFTTKSAGSGVGLGLALCYEIVKRHRGEISVTSKLGQGTTFKVSLPAAPAELAKAPAAERPAAPAQPARVLIIDDEAPLHRALQRVLREHELHVATSGREAIELLERDRGWDLVLCDVVMPDLSGVDVFEKVRRDWPELERRLAFMTGGVRSELLTDVLRAAGRPILEKPLESAALRRLIAELRR